MKRTKPSLTGQSKSGHFTCMCTAINSLPNDKIVDWSNSKESAEDKSYVTEKLKFVLGRVENILGKGEDAGYQFAYCICPLINTPGAMQNIGREPLFFTLFRK